MLQQTLVMLQGFICYCTSRDFSLLLSITSVIPSSFSPSPFPVSVHLCSHPFFLRFLLFLPFPLSLLFSFPYLCSLLSPVMFSISFVCLVPNTGAMLCPKPKSSVKLRALFPSQAPHILSSLNLHLCACQHESGKDELCLTSLQPTCFCGLFMMETWRVELMEEMFSCTSGT